MSPEPRGPLADGRTHEAVAALHAALRDGREPPDFTRPAVDALDRHRREFALELGTAAIYRARRTRADVVSAADVERAAEAVRGARGRSAILMEALGSGAMGAAIGAMLDAAIGYDPGGFGLALAAVALVAGAAVFLAALGAARGTRAS